MFLPISVYHLTVPLGVPYASLGNVQEYDAYMESVV